MKKRFIACLMVIALMLTALQGLSLPVFAASDYFYSSFETTDPLVDVKSVEAEGVIGEGTKTTTFIGEYSNFAATSPVTVNRTLTYGSGSETELALIDGNVGTKLCATAGAQLPLNITFSYASEIAPKVYYISGANDDMMWSSRVVASWTLYGSNTNDGSDWAELDKQGPVRWTSDYEFKYFSIANPTPYKYYQLSITQRGNSPTSSTGIIQFSGFGLGEDLIVSGMDGQVNYLYPQVTTGPAYNWGSPMSGRGWTGKASLLVNGTKTAENAKSYTTIYDNLDISIHENTKLSYLVFPDINRSYDTTAGTNYDFEYTAMHAAVDFVFDDGTRLKDYGALDQYGFEVSPLGQGDAKVMLTNNWLRIESKIGAVPALVGKKISKILVGFEKNGGTLNKPVRTYFDDIKVYREDDPAITNLAEYVNILRGTYTSGNNPARGLNAAIVSTPYPFNYWLPSTEMDNSTPYVYNGADANFKHIKISHVASNWIGDRGTFYISADSTTTYSTASALNSALGSRGSNFLHENEIAHAHYYGVTFNENDAKAPGVKIEVTPTEHAAVLRFTFPAGSAKRNIIVDETVSNSAVQYTSGNAFTAHSSREGNGMRRMYISGSFSETPTAYRSANNQARGMFEFDAAPGNEPTVIELKIATSFMNYDQATKNLNLEIAPSDNFESIKVKALDIWNKSLSVVEIEGGTYDQLVTFYSNLYRNLVYPTYLGENTGTVEEPRIQYTSPYRGSTAAPDIRDGYILYNQGFWDTFRTSWPMYSLLMPGKSTFLQNGLVNHYKDTGWVPRWIAPGGANMMVGTNSDNIFGDAMSHGIDFDYLDAYLSGVKNGSVYSAMNSSNGYSGRSGMNQSVFLGYLPSSSTSDDNLSWSLESYAADYGISVMAKLLRDKETPGTEAWRKLNDEYQYFENKSKLFVNVFNPGVGGWFRGKLANGNWLQTDAQFNPTPFGYGYCEDNAWNYAFHAPHDGNGLANLYGGRKALGEKLDAAFNELGVVDTGTWSGHKENWEGRACKLGMVHMSNEPACHIPYMYLFTDRPWRTQETVRDIMDRIYSGQDVGAGYIGDDDNGAMSAWYCLSALGLYPLTNGDGRQVFGTPLFTKVTINRDNGDTIIINAPKVSRTNKYIQSVRVNDAPYDKVYLEPQQIKDGLTIDFDMGPAPSNFGVDPNTQPPSLTKDEFRPAVLKDLTTDLTPSTTTLPSGNTDGAYTNGSSPAALFNNVSAAYSTFSAGSKLVTYYFNKGAVIEMYTITSGTMSSNVLYAPTEWKLSGSNDGENWTDLDVRMNQSFAWERYTRPFVIDKPQKFNYYKLEFTEAEATVRVAELELMGGEFAMVDRDELFKLIEQAQTYQKEGYEPVSYQALQDAIALALVVYSNENVSVREIAAEIERLNMAIGGLIQIKPAQNLIYGVDCEIYSSGVKKESTSNVSGVVTGTISNLGGLTPGSHVGFTNVDFGEGQYFWTNARMIYAGKQADLTNSRVIVHLDSLIGPVIADFGITYTGANWDVYAYGTGALTQNDITGIHSVYYEFRGSGISVANVHAFSFDYTTPPQPWVTDQTTVAGETNLSIQVSLQNNTETEKTVLVTAAVYNAAGVLVTAKAADAVAVPSKSSVAIPEPLVVDISNAGEGYHVKLFTWNKIDYKPLNEAIVIR